MCEYVLRVFHALRQHSRRGFMQKAAGIPESSRTTHRQKAANVLWTVIRLRGRERERARAKKNSNSSSMVFATFASLENNARVEDRKTTPPLRRCKIVYASVTSSKRRRRKNRPQRAAERQKWNSNSARYCRGGMIRYTARQKMEAESVKEKCPRHIKAWQADQVTSIHVPFRHPAHVKQLLTFTI